MVEHSKACFYTCFPMNDSMLPNLLSCMTSYFRMFSTFWSMLSCKKIHSEACLHSWENILKYVIMHGKHTEGCFHVWKTFWSMFKCMAKHSETCFHAWEYILKHAVMHGKTFWSMLSCMEKHSEACSQACFHVWFHFKVLKFYGLNLNVLNFS